MATAADRFYAGFSGGFNQGLAKAERDAQRK